MRQLRCNLKMPCCDGEFNKFRTYAPISLNEPIPLRRARQRRSVLSEINSNCYDRHGIPLSEQVDEKFDLSIVALSCRQHATLWARGLLGTGKSLSFEIRTLCKVAPMQVPTGSKSHGVQR